MASPRRPYITLKTNEIIEQGEQLLASADINKLRLLLEEISKRKKLRENYRQLLAFK